VLGEEREPELGVLVLRDPAVVRLVVHPEARQEIGCLRLTLTATEPSGRSSAVAMARGGRSPNCSRTSSLTA
jgi:hypothetical protein